MRVSSYDQGNVTRASKGVGQQNNNYSFEFLEFLEKGRNEGVKLGVNS